MSYKDAPIETSRFHVNESVMGRFVKHSWMDEINVLDAMGEFKRYKYQLVKIQVWRTVLCYNTMVVSGHTAMTWEILSINYTLELKHSWSIIYHSGALTILIP